jgi:hypothetical protein
MSLHDVQIWLSVLQNLAAPCPPLAEQANKGVRYGIAHGFDAFLKPSKFLFNLNQFLACVCQIMLCASYGLFSLIELTTTDRLA